MYTPESDARIAIMGAGAIGSVIGGMLARAGHEVTLVGRNPHIRSISENGLYIAGIWGEHTVTNLNAVTSPPCEDHDIVFLTVKSYDTKTAARAALPMLGQGGVIISMQNGLGNVETLAEIAGRERTVGGMGIFGAVVPEPGSVRVTVIASDTLVGEIDGNCTPRVEGIARMLATAGIPTRASEKIMLEIWHKALYNIALNPLSAIFEVTYGEIADSPHTRWLASELISEAFRVAEVAGIDLGMNSPDEYLQILWSQLLPPTRDHRSSMLQDIVRGKLTEIDYINGKVVELGAEYGIETPYNNAVVRMVKAKEVFGPT
ncbi:MAG TPA: ketopantoate reductase family protein [Methanosarcinales archaeon]|nr:ketopantoate reductase family protein [Methanosarcinales archaeon]